MTLQKIRIFLVYAEDDYKFRDLLINQAKSAKLPVEFAEMLNKQPWVELWKKVCRTRATECDGAIILLSKRTKQSAGVKWELDCVSNARLPTLGVYADQCDNGSLPDGLEDVSLIQWSWPEITGFMKSLQSS